MLAATRHLHVSSPHLQSGLRAELAELFDRAHAAGAVTSLDPGWDPAGSWGQGLEGALASIDVFLPNAAEACRFAGAEEPEAALAALADRIETVVVKLGPEGAIARRGDEGARARAPAVEVVDSTGAGDSFAAGFLRGLADGEPLGRSLRLGLACGSLSTRSLGGVDAQPTLGEARDLADALPSRDSSGAECDAPAHRGVSRMSGPRICFIGAGSVEFTGMLIADILGYPELRDVTISLHDIDPERLETAERVAGATAGQLGAGPAVEAHLERRPALEGADYVINMIQVGGHAATVIDHEIPARYGLRQTIGDTLGVGGVFRALRTIPVMQGIAREIAELCPDAWLLNYTNPMAMLCWATYMGSPPARIVGLCHSVQNTTRELAELVAAPFEEVTFLGAGVNHQAFILRFERDGEDLYPRLDEAIERDPELLRRVRVQMYRRLGYFPTESSEHSAEYLPWLMRDDRALERYRLWVAEYVARSEENLAEYERTRALLDASRPLELEPSNEYAPQIIHSIETGTPRVIYGNVRNTGLIENLRADSCVEVPCVVDATGVDPVWIGELPPQLAALNRTYLNVAELTVRAALEGRPEYVRHAVMLDPNAGASLSLDEIWDLCDELTAAHGDALPEALRAPARVGAPVGDLGGRDAVTPINE
jgi:alpha-galactosidase